MSKRPLGQQLAMLQQRVITPPDRRERADTRMNQLIADYMASRYPRLTHAEYGRLVAILQEREHEPHQRS